MSGREKLFFCEGAILLLLSHLSVKTVAFRHIDQFLSALWKDDDRTGHDAMEDVRLVNLSLARAINLSRANDLCLSRSIAAFIMLRRRGIPAVIIAGVKFSSDSSLQAHAWVDAGCSELNAGSKSSTFTPVIRIG